MSGRRHEVRVGLSGWDYPAWQDDFYPRSLTSRQRLPFVAERFSTVEVNGSFYSLQRPSTYLRWRDSTPDSFLFALKGGRYVTHLKRLRDVQQGLANFFASGPLALDTKLGPILWQLPASLDFEPDVVERFVDLLPRSTASARSLARRHDANLKDRAFLGRGDRPLCHAIEPRNRSFDVPAFRELLAERGMSFVVSDSPTWPLFDPGPGPIRYVRLHGHSALYASRYSSASLDRWADKCRQWVAEAPVFVYFDNDARGHAPRDAQRLMRRIGVPSFS